MLAAGMRMSGFTTHAAMTMWTVSSFLMLWTAHYSFLCLFFAFSWLGIGIRTFEHTSEATDESSSHVTMFEGEN